MAATHEGLTSAQLHARLKHPVIDSDGHMLEVTPVLLDYIRQLGGPQMAERFIRDGESGRPWAGWKTMSHADRRSSRTPASAWWGLAPNTLDRATASLARLQHERMDDLGLDFAVLYPTDGLSVLLIPDDELRQLACRAMNTYYADQYRPYADRLTPTAIIPINTPQEAVNELEYAVNTLGLKAIAIMGQIHRPIPLVQSTNPQLARHASYLDFLGVDSDHDYDPFWSKCVELKVAVGAHGSGQGWGARRSISRYVYNHIGSFAAASEAFCKALVMGGVPRRYPNLQFAFLEGGVAWACELYAGLIGHWKKRNARQIRNLDPANWDQEELLQLFSKYGDARITARLADIREQLNRPHYQPAELDDFADAAIENARDFRDIFQRQFYFGCEADDPLNAWAYNTRVNPYGARLRPILGSDIGHWDVSDMTEVLTEAYELVEHELITESEFRDFTFANPVNLYSRGNPDFFKGTRVESQAQAQMVQDGAQMAQAASPAP